MEFSNLPEMFFARAARFGSRGRYRVKRNGAWQDVSWVECATRVREIAAGLCALGVAPGARVALLSATRPEWMEIDLAILSTGALTIPIYPSVLAPECGYILWNSEASVAIVENERQAEKVRAAAADGIEIAGTRHSVAAVERVVVVDRPGKDEGTLGLDALRDLGRERLGTLGPEIERRIGRQGRNDLATIVYTSGTTGPPKGVLQTHGNHLSTIEAIARVGLAREGDIDLFFLPLAHSFARMIEYYGLYVGTTTAFAQSIDTLSADIAETSPQLIPAVPRVYEKIYGRILATRTAGSAAKRAIFDWALAVGRAWSARVQAREPVPLPLQALHAVADRLVFRKIHDVLGGQVRFLVSGGAPLAREIAEFFHAVGLLVLEGYGLTETTPALTVNRPDRFKFGTVGLPLDGVDVRIAPDGEIIAKGPNIALGYHKRPEETAAAWDADGWFHTGDIGELDAEGFLRITDRKKDLIKTSGGKYVAPQNIENALKTQPHVSQAVVIGDRRKYCVALVTLDADAIQVWASGRGVSFASPEEMARHPEIVKLVDAEVRTVNQRLASFESVKYFRVLPRDFSVESGELTPSLKVKRKVIEERYRAEIEAMYSD
jgi:long-chain acyl-CoA synthetase